MRIQIVEPGWRGFSDFMGPVEFKDNVSVRDVTDHELNTISSSIRVIEYAEGVEGDHQVGLSVTAVEIRDLHVEPEPICQVLKGPIKLAGGKPQTNAHGEARPKILTDKELEQIADDKGIQGLRDIGVSWGVKGRAINELMSSIKAAQAAEAYRQKGEVS